MHRTARATVLGAVAIAAALGLSGCGGADNADPASPGGTPSPDTTSAAAAPESPPPAPLPAPGALTDVLAKLADPSLAGADKVGLVEYATADDAAALDRFGRALRDGGLQPVSFEARDLAWAQSHPGNVLATIVVKTAKPQGGDFTYPMEFSPTAGSWQLTRQTADLLLQLDQSPTATPSR